MKKILALFILVFALSSCFGGDKKNETLNGTSLKAFEWSGFTLSVPSDWETKKEIETLPIPAHGKVVLTSKSPTTKYNFSNNLLVIQDTLGNPTSSANYSEMNNTQTTRKYLEYSPILTQEILFSDSDTSKVYVFDAKYNTNTPTERFIQTAKVCGTQVYVLHFTVSLDRQAKDYINIFKTFICK